MHPQLARLGEALAALPLSVLSTAPAPTPALPERADYETDHPRAEERRTVRWTVHVPGAEHLVLASDPRHSLTSYESLMLRRVRPDRSVRGHGLRCAVVLLHGTQSYLCVPRTARPLPSSMIAGARASWHRACRLTRPATPSRFTTVSPTPTTSPTGAIVSPVRLPPPSPPGPPLAHPSLSRHPAAHLPESVRVGLRENEAWWQGTLWALARLLSETAAQALDPTSTESVGGPLAPARTVATNADVLEAGPSPASAPVLMAWHQLTIVRLRLADASTVARAQPLAAALASVAVPDVGLATMLLSALDGVAEPLRGYIVPMPDSEGGGLSNDHGVLHAAA
jgi:hypothetical protein